MSHKTRWTRAKRAHSLEIQAEIYGTEAGTAAWMRGYQMAVDDMMRDLDRLEDEGVDVTRVRAAILSTTAQTQVLRIRPPVRSLF